VITNAHSDLATGVAGRDERMQHPYDAHARPLYRFLLRLTFGDRLAAEDLMQETLLRAWKKSTASTRTSRRCDRGC
jgi:RNA polymerase sigma-70 factor (ECF subfamily)